MITVIFADTFSMYVIHRFLLCDCEHNTVSVGCNKHFCFKPLPLEIDFFTSLTKSCGEIALLVCYNDIDHKCTHGYLYQ